MNRFRLEYEMKSRGASVANLCDAVGMSRSAFYRKCAGLSEFTAGEIQKIIDFLDIKTPMGIFFEEKVS